MIFYEAYCEAGGKGQAKEHNEAIFAAIRKEMRGEEGVPTAIMADFNCTPEVITNVQELVDDESWVDVGHCADWWGGTADQPTCHQRAAARETRIDGILYNMWMTPFIQNVEVWKDDEVPTHKIVQMTLGTKTEGKNNTYLRSLPS